MRARGEKGTVLVHVLVTAVIVMIIAAGLMRVILMRYVAQNRFEDSGQNRRSAESAVAQVSAAWAKNGSCTAVPNFGPPSAAGCSCELDGTGANAGVVVQAVPAGGAMPSWASPPFTCGATSPSCCIAVQVGNNN